MTRTANDVLNQEFLQVRAKLLEVAAFFDRLGEAEAGQVDQQRLELLKAGCQLLDDSNADKAARLQLLFSREYQADWRKQFSL